jgi:predicted GTPase
MITLVDALRPDQLTTHHPGETTLRLADFVVIAKCDAAEPAAVEALKDRLAALLPERPIVRAASPVALDDPDAVAGKRVLVVEDGPTITHGGMPWGAGHHAVSALPGVTLVDARECAHPEISKVFDAFPHIGPVLPAMGYGVEQLAALQATIDAAPADVVVAATPIDLAAQIKVRQPIIRARYRYDDIGEPRLNDLVDARLFGSGLL